ncbi:hypothetical protein AUH73_03440 [archaeon 13_1_40CM_4_53_4]|nr:MAG: hypothetical protein AUI07_05955 [archaeon 13_2_20CM_2_53_6]OLC62884.1 MAG: hypothetical protein AUH73_03440 [archaeon 13_1_40CM_4_53_4]
MSQRGSETSETTKEKASAPTCTCDLVVNDQGTWELRPDPSPECVGTVEALANSLGPNARQYLAKHIAPNGEKMQEAVDKLEGSESES